MSFAKFDSAFRDHRHIIYFEGIENMLGNWFQFIFLVSTVLSCAAHAADIRVDSFRTGGAIFEGEIVTGDFEKLQSFIFDGTGATEIYLASPGGNLFEAMKIGRFVRALKLATVVPDKALNENFQEKLAAKHGLKNFNANYKCTSACFFIFIAGVHRQSDFIEDGAILGIHRPYLSEKDLKAISSDKAISAATQTRIIVENYFREMDAPTKYVDQMFSVPKDKIRWIEKEEFDVDFSGFIPGLRDWVDARCDRFTEVEKKVWKELKDKVGAQLSTAEKVMMDAQVKKHLEQLECENKIQTQLALKAYVDALEKRSGK